MEEVLVPEGPAQNIPLEEAVPLYLLHGGLAILDYLEVTGQGEDTRLSKIVASREGSGAKAKATVVPPLDDLLRKEHLATLCHGDLPTTGKCSKLLQLTSLV